MPVPWVPWDSFFCCFLGLCSAMFIALRSLGFQDIIDVRCEAGCWFNAWGGCVLGVVEKHHIQPAQIFWFRVLTSPPQKKKALPVERFAGPSKGKACLWIPIFQGLCTVWGAGGMPGIQWPPLPGSIFWGYPELYLHSCQWSTGMRNIPMYCEEPKWDQQWRVKVSIKSSQPRLIWSDGLDNWWV